MSDLNWQRIEGIIERGHRVASGLAQNSPYPQGTIAMQIPFFQALGLDLMSFFQGTLNISISPKIFRLVEPTLTFKNLEWTDKHPPETFSFSPCRIIVRDSSYDCWVYYPHPETKKQHFQAPSVIEIIAPPIADIEYGDRVILEYNPKEIAID